jgi:signal transduction histidine kinase/ActR/RegA family two-component response regulator
VPSSRAIRLSHSASAWAGAIVTGVGLLALLGWILEDEGLKALYSGGIVIKTNTAIGLCAIGLALMLRGRESAGRVRSSVGAGFAVLAGLLGALTLSEHLFQWNLGIDELLFREPSDSPATSSPNRMGPPASVAFPLAGLCILLLNRRTAGGSPRSQPFAFAILLIAFLPILGYVFGVRELYGLAKFTGVALPTALALLVLGLGVLAARPESGVVRRISSEDAGGLLLRRLIPTAIVLPVVLGWLRVLGQNLGYYDADFGRVLLILSFVIVFTAAIWWTGTVVHQQAVARARAEGDARAMQERVLMTLESERNARAMAERSNRMKDDFLATLSHELRTPLNAILGWVQLLSRGSLDPRDAKRGLEAIERNSRLQAQLIEDLLDMSRIESGKVRLDMREVELGLVIESAIAAVAPSADSKGVEIERRIDGTSVMVRGDGERLQQVLWNLLTNAIKFTPRGGKVTVELTTHRDEAEITVRDTGIGIQPEFLEHVFDRFRQADPSTTRRFGGLGLGLAIARQLTELHGGTLKAHSDGEGTGAAFSIALPLTAAMSLDRGSRFGLGAGEAGRTPDGELTGLRVLAVDDHVDACDLIERVLQDRGADVRTANSVEEAIGWLERRHFDVLVSDIGMPVRDGFDLIRYVRAHVSDLPAVALTAFARPEDEQRVLAAGFDYYLSKPLMPDRLMTAIKAVMPPRPAAAAGTGPGTFSTPPASIRQAEG